jgi:hypothetical protein
MSFRHQPSLREKPKVPRLPRVVEAAESSGHPAKKRRLPETELQSVEDVGNDDFTIGFGPDLGLADPDEDVETTVDCAVRLLEINKSNHANGCRPN